MKEIILRNVNQSVSTKHQDLLYTITSQQEAFLLPNCMQTANYSFTCASHCGGEETVVVGIIAPLLVTMVRVKQNSKNSQSTTLLKDDKTHKTHTIM